MANLEVLALDTATPQIRAPGAGDGYAVPRDMTFSPGTTLSVPNAQVTNVKANDGTAAIAIADSTGAVTVSTPTVVSVNSSSDALRVTQTGAGNALVVEDSANPDSTPFVVDANGRVLAGQSVGYATFGDFLNTARNPQIQYSGTTTPSAMMSIANWSNLASSPATLNLAKSRGAAVGSQAVVLNGDDIGVLEFSADDGTNFVPAATILAEVDGTPGTNDMPGRLVFSTTADGASTPTERMRIDNAGRVGFNSTSLGGASGAYRFSGNITGSINASGILYTPTVSSDVTSNATLFAAFPSTQDDPFALTSITYFSASQGTITGGTRTAPTSQFGFRVESNFTGATNNYGFWSNIASGTNRWNFFSNGTAQNYFAGNTLIGSVSATNNLRLNQKLAVVNAGSGQYAGASLTAYSGTTQDASPLLDFQRGRGTTDGSMTAVIANDRLGYITWRGSDGTAFVNAAIIKAEVDGTPATNDMPGRLMFLTSPAGSATPTERMRIDNAGNVVVNTAAIATTATDGFLYVPSCAGTPTGTPTTYTGRVPIVVDTTNHKLYFYSGGTWRDAGP